jgi:hypothetical protein
VVRDVLVEAGHRPGARREQKEARHSFAEGAR